MVLKMKFSWAIQDVCSCSQKETTHQRDSQKQQKEEEALLALQMIIWNIKICIVASSSTTETFYNQDFFKTLVGRPSLKHFKGICVQKADTQHTL